MIAYLASNPLLAAALLLGLSVAVATSLWLSIPRLSSVSLVAATKHPFAKYIVLSILAHVALAIWLYSFYFNLGSGHSRRTNPVTVRIASDSSETEQPENDKPWDAPSPRAIDAPLPGLAEEPVAPPPERTRPDPNLAEPGNSLLGQLNALPTDLMVEADSSAQHSISPAVADLASVNSNHSVSEPHSQSAEPASKRSQLEIQEPPQLAEEPAVEEAAESTSADTALHAAHGHSAGAPQTERAAAQDNVQDDILAKSGSTTPQENNLQPLATNWDDASDPAVTSKEPAHAPRRTVPQLLQDRLLKDKISVVQSRGGSDRTEQAVIAALNWLASAQNEDGRWDASRFGSGQRFQEGGHDRQGAGLNADTGITGLALLAFLGSGHTHREGDYVATVRRGIDYLRQTQRRHPQGSLAGDAGAFAAMYCHGIATLAISEAYALTGDPELSGPTRRAVAFTLAAQHPTNGGWRYRAGQPGDTSQLGWQLMSLTSAHYSGVSIPRQTWSRAGRFLRSVSWGNHGGLAAYRPDQRPSHAMTAEALLCWLFLRVDSADPLIQEGAHYLMTELPGEGRVNYYYWYYGTLALYHLQDEHWQRWNSAVTRQLVHRQATDGSWDANSVWGPSGGRVYATALATLTLEVYYRYRPLSEPRQVHHTAWNRR